jgi:hypothetical protein
MTYRFLPFFFHNGLENVPVLRLFCRHKRKRLTPREGMPCMADGSVSSAGHDSRRCRLLREIIAFFTCLRNKDLSHINLCISFGYKSLSRQRAGL